MKYPIKWREAFIDLIQEHGREVMSGKSTAEVCQPVIDMARKLSAFSASVVTVWSVDPRSERLIRVAGGFPIDPLTGLEKTPSSDIPSVLEIAHSLTGAAYESRRPRIWNDLKSIQEGRKFDNTELVDEFKLQSMLSLPIPNIGNPHQISLVMNFFFAEEIPEESLEHPDLRRELQAVLSLFASGIESNLRERAYRMSTSTSYALGRIEYLTPESAASTLARAVQRSISADYVSVFLEDWDRTIIPKGHAWADNDPKWDSSQESLPCKVQSTLEENREFLAPVVSWKKEEIDELLEKKLLGILPTHPVESVLLIPLQDDKGVSRGVLRAVNLKREDRGTWRQLHTYDDIAIVEAMGRSFSPLLDRLLESVQRNTSLQTLAHELRVPVVALRAVHSRMEREYDANSTFRFQFPYFNEVGVYTEIMQRQMREIEIVRIGPESLDLVPQSTHLWTEVIMPAKRFIGPILNESGMTTQQINAHGFENAPNLSIDQALITQVIFNLMDNSIKYYPKTRPLRDFKCDLYGYASGDIFKIEVHDNGSGLSEQDSAKLFGFGYRSQSARAAEVRGTGIGLWMSRGIIRRHGGDLCLTKNSKPTIFTITLPLSPKKEERR